MIYEHILVQKYVCLLKPRGTIFDHVESKYYCYYRTEPGDLTCTPT